MIKEKQSFPIADEAFDEKGNIRYRIFKDEKGIEINTGSLRKGTKEASPCCDVLKRYHELGGEIITVGSDAHIAADVAADFDCAAEYLKACGFKYYCVFENRLPEYKKL